MGSRDFAVDGLFFKLVVHVPHVGSISISGCQCGHRGHVAPESTEPSQGEIPAVAATGILKSPRKLIGSSPPICNGKCGGCVPCNRHLVGGDGGEYFIWRCSCEGKLYIP